MADDTNTAEREEFSCCNTWFESLPEGRKAVLRDDKWMLAHAAFQAGRASLAASAASAGSEPVAIYHGRCVIDCGEHGHLDMELLKMIPAGTKLYTHPSPTEGMTGWKPIETAPKDEMYRDGPNAYAEYILVWYPGAIAPIRARWWQSDSDKCNFLADGGYAVFPTVWQPLPATPLPASEAKEL